MILPAKVLKEETWVQQNTELFKILFSLISLQILTADDCVGKQI